MNLLPLLLINLKNTGNDFLQRLCFQNNVRSKYLTLALVAIGLVFASYDILILQKTLTFNVFLIHFKTDLVFLVLSSVFTLYVYFNQVKTHRDIQKHHKYIHRVIALAVLIWSVFKSVIFVKFNGGNYNVAIICILTTGFIYVFPSVIYFAQLALTVLLALITSLIFNFTVYQIIKDLYILVTIALISFIVSRYIFYLHLRIFSKEKELARYKKRMTGKK